MQMPTQGTGWESLVNELGVFHLTRMRADPATRELSAVFEKRQAALEAKGQAFLAAARAKTAAEAVLTRTDLDMDNLVRELFFQKIAACANNRNNPELRKWFPDGLSRVVRDNYAGELGQVRALILVLGEHSDDPLAARFLPEIKAMAETYAQAIDALKNAIASAAGAWSLVEAEKVNWLTCYQRDFADLLSLCKGDKRTADTFFKKPAKARKTEAPQTVPPASAAS
jgi:hypothetical protein